MEGSAVQYGQGESSSELEGRFVRKGFKPPASTTPKSEEGPRSSYPISHPEELRYDSVRGMHYYGTDLDHVDKPQQEPTPLKKNDTGVIFSLANNESPLSVPMEGSIPPHQSPSSYLQQPLKSDESSIVFTLKKQENAEKSQDSRKRKRKKVESEQGEEKKNLNSPQEEEEKKLSSPQEEKTSDKKNPHSDKEKKTELKRSKVNPADPDPKDEEKAPVLTSGEEEEEEVTDTKNEEIIPLPVMLPGGALPGLEDMEENILSEADGRTKVATPDVYPWCVHGHMLIEFAPGARYLGSGTLIKGKYVLTAAHNLYDRKTQTVAKTILFYPGRNDTHVPWSAGVCAIALHPEWYKSSSSVEVAKESDIGIMKLDMKIGKKVGYYGYAVLDDVELGKEKLNVTGYPGGSHKGKFMLTMNGDLKEAQVARLFYKIDTTGGQSGSAVYRIYNDQETCVAVHAYGGSLARGNSGTRINQEKFEKIEEWLKELKATK